MVYNEDLVLYTSTEVMQQFKVHVPCCVHGGYNDFTESLDVGVNSLVLDEIQPQGPLATPLLFKEV